MGYCCLRACCAGYWRLLFVVSWLLGLRAVRLVLGCSKGLFLAVRDYFQGSEAAVGATLGCVEALLAGLWHTWFDLGPSRCTLGRSWAVLGSS